MVEVVRMVCLDFLVQARSEGGAAMLLDAAAGAAGGNASEEVGYSFILWAFG